MIETNGAVYVRREVNIDKHIGKMLRVQVPAHPAKITTLNIRFERNLKLMIAVWCYISDT